MPVSCSIASSLLRIRSVAQFAAPGDGCVPRSCLRAIAVISNRLSVQRDVCSSPRCVDVVVTLEVSVMELVEPIVEAFVLRVVEVVLVLVVKTFWGCWLRWRFRASSRKLPSGA